MMMMEGVFHLFSRGKGKTDLDEGEGLREDILDQERKRAWCPDRDQCISRRTSDVGHDAEDIGMGLEGRKHEFGLVGS
jgi:hypothetical protein